MIDLDVYTTSEVDQKLADAQAAVDAEISKLPTPTDGKDGVNGVNGSDGAVGPQGPIGPTGPQGATGPQGVSGKDGADGATGPAGASGSGASFITGLWLDSFAGKTDDDKLDAAILKISSGQLSLPILLSNRVYSFSKNRTVGNGFKLIQPFGFGDQARGANSIPCLVKFAGSGVWLTFGPGNVFDVQISGFGTQGNSKSQAFATASGAVLWTSIFRDLAFTEWAAVWGTPAAPFVNDAILIDGFINVNNTYGCAGCFAGSDSSLFMGFTLIDTPVGYSASQPGHFQLEFHSQSKTEIGPIYMTAEGCKGILFSGSMNGRTTLNHPKIEGRNLNAPSSGPLIEVRDGQVIVDKAWLGYSKGDFILQSGGTVIVDAAHFGQASGGPTKVLNQTGGIARVLNAIAQWSGVIGVSGSNVTADTSVSKV